MKSCFLIGHRDASESLYPLIVNEIERHIIEYNVNEFIAGQYGQFDRMTARATRALKARHPAVRLVLLLPYLRNESLPKGFDESVYPDGLECVPKWFAISRANQAMVDRCDYLITNVSRHYGGAWQCMEYARRKGKHITNIQDRISHTAIFKAPKM